MSSFNRVILMGNITRDIELRSAAGDKSVAQVGLAVNHRYVTSGGEKLEEVVFVDCEAWGKTAENMARYLAKGKSVLIEGRLKLDQWKDRADGSNRSKLKVVIDTFSFVSGQGGDEKPAAKAKPAPAARSGNYHPGVTGYMPIDESEIPFHPTHGI